MGSFVNHVLGACDASGACATGGTCASFFVCSPGPVTPDAGHPGVDAGVVPEHATYCGCRAGSRGGSVTSSALMLAALALFVARRQR